MNKIHVLRNKIRVLFVFKSLKDETPLVFSILGYYEDPPAFFAEKFGPEMEKKFAPHGAFIEQDGLIQRLLIDSELLMLVPRCPRAFHAGFVGYNRQSVKDKANDIVAISLQERHAALI